MELMNELAACESAMSPPVRQQCAATVTLLIAPFAPFAAEELWALMGRPGPVFKQPWPRFDENLAREEALEIPVQVNGKLRSKITVPNGSSDDEQKAAALADDRIRQLTEGKQVVKTIVVSGKLVNLVVKG